MSCEIEKKIPIERLQLIEEMYGDNAVTREFLNGKTLQGRSVRSGRQQTSGMAFSIKNQRRW
jgi:hypothetical protein